MRRFRCSELLGSVCTNGTASGMVDGVRLFQVDAEQIFFDDGTSMRCAALGIAVAVSRFLFLQNIHPPLYMLHFYPLSMRTAAAVVMLSVLSMESKKC